MFRKSFEQTRGSFAEARSLLGCVQQGWDYHFLWHAKLPLFAHTRCLDLSSGVDKVIYLTRLNLQFTILYYYYCVLLTPSHFRTHRQLELFSFPVVWLHIYANWLRVLSIISKLFFFFFFFFFFSILLIKRRCRVAHSLFRSTKISFNESHFKKNKKPIVYCLIFNSYTILKRFGDFGELEIYRKDKTSK